MLLSPVGDVDALSSVAHDPDHDGPKRPAGRAEEPMGDKSPKAKNRNKKQSDAKKKDAKDAKDRKQAPPTPPAKRG